MSRTRRYAATLAAVAVTGAAIGYGTASATRTGPEHVTVTVRVPVTPAACRTALRLTEARAAAATDYAATALKVAPLLTDVYAAGLNGTQEPAILDRITTLNEEARRTWRAADRTADRAATAAEECRNR
jgi:hypothetical protein